MLASDVDSNYVALYKSDLATPISGAFRLPMLFALQAGRPRSRWHFHSSDEPSVTMRGAVAEVTTSPSGYGVTVARDQDPKKNCCCCIQDVRVGPSAKHDEWKGPKTEYGKRVWAQEEEAKKKNPKAKGRKWPTEGAYADEFSVIVKYAYFKDKGEGDCRIEWYEWSVFRSDAEIKAGAKTEDWWEVTGEGRKLDSLIDWDARGELPTERDEECDGKSREVTLYDVPQVAKGQDIRSMRFIAVYAYSGEKCSCGENQPPPMFALQVIDDRIDPPKRTPREFVAGSKVDKLFKGYSAKAAGSVPARKPK